MSKSIIKLNDICKTYKTKHIVTKALSNISVEIYEGEFITITGPSGCGKSTLLSIIGLLNNPTSGNYSLAGINVDAFSASELAQIRNKHIGFVFQSFNLIPELNVLDNVGLPLKFQGVSKKLRREKSTKILTSLNLEKRLRHYPSQLSGGQQQRVAIARALINEPDIILADEPTGNLDSDIGRQIMGILSDLHKKGQTILMVTHDLEYAKLSTRNLKLKDGEFSEFSCNG